MHADQDGVAVLKPQYNFYLVTGNNPMAFVNKIVSPELIELCGSRCALQMKAHCNLETVLECHQYYYPHATIQSDLPLEKLTPSDAEFVFDHYDLADPPKKLLKQSSKDACSECAIKANSLHLSACTGITAWACSKFCLLTADRVGAKSSSALDRTPALNWRTALWACHYRE